MSGAILLLPGLSCRWLAAYGNPWLELPAFERLAARSVVWERLFAPDPSPEAAFAAWLADAPKSALVRSESRSLGRLDARFPAHRVAIAEADTPAKDWADTLRTFLAEAQEDSLVWAVNGDLLTPWPDVDDKTYLYFHARLGPLTTDAPDEERDADPRSPETVEVEIPPPVREPWKVVGEFDADEYRRRVHATQACLLVKLDRWLGDFLDAWQDGPPAWLLVASPFGQRQELSDWCGKPPSPVGEDFCHLPAFLLTPDDAGAGRRVAGIDHPRGLLAKLLSSGANPTALIETTRPESPFDSALIHRSDDVRAARFNGWLARWAGAEARGELFRKPDDRYEVADVAANHLDYVERLTAIVRDPINADSMTVEVPTLEAFMAEKSGSEEASDGDRQAGD